MKRSIVTVLGLAAAASLVLAGCGGSVDAVSGSNGPVTLTFVSWTPSTTTEFKTLADGFHAANPNVTVQMREYDAKNYDTQVMADLAAGKPLDVYVQKNLMNFYTYQSGNRLLDVSDVTKGLSSRVGGVDSYKVDGKAYAVPYRQDSWVLFYNKELFDKAGVAYPDGSWTWDDYANVSKQLTTKLKAAQVPAVGDYQHTWQSTVQGFALAQTPNANLQSGDFSYLKPYYQRTVDLQASGAQVSFIDATAKSTTYQAQFGRQHAAMMLMGTWFISTLLNQQTDGTSDRFAWGMAPAPQLTSSTAGRSKTPVTFGDPTGMGINPTISKDKLAAAKAFLAYAAGDQGAKALAGIGITPANAMTQQFFELKGMPTDDLSKFAFATHDTKPENPALKHAAGLQAILNDLHTSVMSGSKNVDDAISDAQTRARNVVLKN